MGANDIQWLNTSESARMLGVTTRTLYRFIDEGKLPAYRFGRVIRLKADEINEFIDGSRIVPGSLGTAEVESAQSAQSARSGSSGVTVTGQRDET